MNKTLLYILLLCISNIINAQNTSIDKILKKFNSNTVTYIKADSLAKKTSNYIILDTREEIEFNTSHLKHAKHVGYDNFSIDNFKNTHNNKKDTIIVYCSVGVRSEDIGELIKKAGFNNVYNLYGGIFEWKNKGLPVIDSTKNETENVHVFSKKWGKYLTNGIKVY